MRKLLHIISSKKGSFVKADLRQIVCVVIPKLIGGFSQLLLSMLLVRFLGVDQFGMVSVCLTGVLLLDAIAGAALDMAIFRLAPLRREASPEAARAIEKAGLLIKPAAAAIIMLPLLFAAPTVSSLLFQDPTRASLLLWSALALLGMLLFRSMQVHFQIEGRFEAYGGADLLLTVARFGFIGLLLASGLATPERLMAAYGIAGLLVAAAGLLWPARAVLKAAWGPTLAAARELCGLLKWYLATVALGSFASRMDVFFVSSFGNVREAGIYAAAQMFALVPTLLGMYLSVVFSPKVLPMWHDGTLRQTYARYQIFLCALAALMFALCVMALGPLRDLVLPQAYQQSPEVILLLLPTGLASFINFPWTIPLILYTRPKLLLAVDCVAIPAMAVVFAWAIPRWGAVGAAAVSSAFAALRLVFYQDLGWRVLRGVPIAAVAGNLAIARSAS